jgi:hypothetical protein
MLRSWTLALALATLALLATAGCKRLAYWSPSEANHFAVPASAVHAAARAVADEQAIEGASWAVESDTPTQMRVVHTTDGHETILELRFVADSAERSSLEALGYSLAPWSWATFGMTSAWKAATAEQKSRGFVELLRTRAGAE